MTADAAQLAWTASWVGTGLGAGLWLWSWVRVKDPIQKLRFLDCGTALVFASILVRVVVQDRAMSVFDWVWVVVSPLFIAGALWRLARTSGQADEDR